jgi:hypothetical protein
VHTTRVVWLEGRAAPLPAAVALPLRHSVCGSPRNTLKPQGVACIHSLVVSADSQAVGVSPKERVRRLDSPDSLRAHTLYRLAAACCVMAQQEPDDVRTVHNVSMLCANRCSAPSATCADVA